MPSIILAVVDTERRKNGSDNFVAYNIETKVIKKNPVFYLSVVLIFHKMFPFFFLRFLKMKCGCPSARMMFGGVIPIFFL